MLTQLYAARIPFSFSHLSQAPRHGSRLIPIINLLIVLLPHAFRPLRMDIPGELLNMEAQIACLGRRDEPLGFGEERVHLLQRPLLRLRHQRPEEQRVGEVADDEGDEVAPRDVGEGRCGYLSDECVEGERHHDAERHAFGAGFHVEDFGGDDPG